MADARWRRLLVVRLGSLGDLVHTLPAVAAIRLVHPSRRSTGWSIGCIASSWTWCPSSRSIDAARASRRAAGGCRRAANCGRGQYDVAIDFQGLLKSAALARLVGRRDGSIGFDRAAASREPAAAWLYSERVAVG